MVSWATDVGEDTSFGDSSVGQEFVEFFVVSDGQEDMSWNDSDFFIVLGGVACEFQDFSGQVFKNGGEINWDTGTDSFNEVSVSKKSSDSSDWKLKTSS